MTSKCSCDHCGGHLEFDASLAGQATACPHCGGETTLRLSETATPEAETPPQADAPASQENPHLRPCVHCGKDVSVDANVCPHCGLPFWKEKRRRVFRSLRRAGALFIGMIVLVYVMDFCGGLARLEKKMTSSMVTESVVPQSKPWRLLSEQETIEAEAILRDARTENDEVTGATWIFPKGSEWFENEVYVYIGFSEKEQPFLRMRVDYSGERSLRMQRLVFRIDDTLHVLTPEEPVKRDYSRGIYRERLDDSGTLHLELLGRIAKGNKVIMRYEGSNFVKDEEVIDWQKRSLREMLLLYRYFQDKQLRQRSP